MHSLALHCQGYTANNRTIILAASLCVRSLGSRRAGPLRGPPLLAEADGSRREPPGSPGRSLLSRGQPGLNPRRTPPCSHPLGTQTCHWIKINGHVYFTFDRVLFTHSLCQDSLWQGRRASNLRNLTNFRASYSKHVEYQDYSLGWRKFTSFRILGYLKSCSR